MAGRNVQTLNANEVHARSSAPRAHDWRAKAFDAQRHDINTQAGPSNNRHLSALDKLQKRDFKPAVGGLEIPSTPHSLLGGGGKRVYQMGEASRHVTVVPIGNRDELEEKITDKRIAIQVLTQELATETDPVERGLTAQTLQTARTELAELMARAAVLRNEHRRINS